MPILLPRTRQKRCKSTKNKPIIHTYCKKILRKKDIHPFHTPILKPDAAGWPVNPRKTPNNYPVRLSCGETEQTHI